MNCEKCHMKYPRYIKKIIIEDIKTIYMCIFCLVKHKILDEDIFFDE